MRRLALAAALALAACSGEPQGELSELAQQGRQLYVDVCIACHNGDPNVDGALGPAIAGSSEELLRAKVLRGEYPPGYLPKRPDSNAMIMLPGFGDKMPALAAYLAEVDEREE